VEQSAHHITAPEDRIPIFQKAVYSIGALVNQTQAAAITGLVLVLNLGLGMSPILVGLVGMIPRLIDANTDPMIGYTSDNTRSRYGRRRLFILFGALFSGILFALMFQLYKGQSEMYYFWYFLGFQCLFVIAFAFYSIPWIALGFEMTPDYHERTRLQGAGNSVAQIAWFCSPWLFTFMYSGSKDLVHGVRWLAVIIGVFIAVGGILPAIFNKEYFTNLPKPQKKNVMKDFFSGFAITLKNRPFVKLCAVTFLVYNGFMLASAFTTYVIFFYVYGRSASMDIAYSKGGILLGMYGMFSAFCMSCAIVLITWISTKIGKRNTFLIAIPISIVGYALKWIGYNPQHPYLLLIAAPFIAFGLGSVFTIISSMLADVCDLDELDNGTRREGTFGAIYWWMIKLGQAAASLISGVLLVVTGFNVSFGIQQSAHALLYMRLCDIGIPIVTSIIAIFIILTFDITEDKAYDIRRQLEARRGKG